jgi:hypothetical protein
VIELELTTIFALTDGSKTRLQCYAADGQILQLVIDEATRNALLLNLERAARAQRANDIAGAKLAKPQPPATRVDGWDV